MKPDVLVGGKISQVLEVDGSVILIVEKAGRVYQIEPWSDEEGNSAGHLDISIIPGATAGAQVKLAGPEDASR